MKRINDCQGPGGGWGTAIAEEIEASSEAGRQRWKLNRLLCDVRITQPSPESGEGAEASLMSRWSIPSLQRWLRGRQASWAPLLNQCGSTVPTAPTDLHTPFANVAVKTKAS